MLAKLESHCEPRCLCFITLTPLCEQIARVLRQAARYLDSRIFKSHAVHTNDVRVTRKFLVNLCLFFYESLLLACIICVSEKL